MAPKYGQTNATSLECSKISTASNPWPQTKQAQKSERDFLISSSFKKIAFDSSERILLLTLKWTLGVHRKTSNLAVWGIRVATIPAGLRGIEAGNRLLFLPSRVFPHRLPNAPCLSRPTVPQLRLVLDDESPHVVIQAIQWCWRR